jgi:signal peptidase I
VKRLVGLPGEFMEIRAGSAWANGKRLIPPTRLGPIRYTTQDNWRQDVSWTVGYDEYFVLGDNTDHCTDSRFYGPIPREQLLGVVEAIYWPPNRWRLNP